MTEEQKSKMVVVFNEHLSYGSKPVPEDLVLPQSQHCGDHASHQPDFLYQIQADRTGPERKDHQEYLCLALSVLVP